MDFSETPSLSLYPFPNVKLSDEEFKQYHNVDRVLFSRLVIGLGRDPAQSIQVVAFWLWLEKAANDTCLAKKLMSFPPELLGEAAEETVVCLKCVKDNSNSPLLFELALLPNLITRKNIVLAPLYLHRNRCHVMAGLKKYVTKVCFRAFDDILRLTAVNPPAPPVGPSHMAPHVGEISLHSRRLNRPSQVAPHSSPTDYQVMGETSLVRRGLQHFYPPIILGPTSNGSPKHVGPLEMSLPPLPPPPPPMMKNETVGMVNKGEIVHPDERTIFLTFSKGYPISEQEVKDFFSRKFGDIIEAIHMQEVGNGDQVLYARVVARNLAALEAIVLGGKAKYNINGKHVWARKYVKKQSSKVTSSSSSTSAAAATTPSSSKP